MNVTEISQEERDLWRFEASDECGTPSEEDERILRLLSALDTAEAERKKDIAHCKFEFDRAEKAEADNAALKEDLESTGKSLNEYADFFEQLCDGLKKRFPVQYSTIDGDEYGDDAFSANDVFDHVLDPVIRGANEAESQVARLTAVAKFFSDNRNGCSECTLTGAESCPDEDESCATTLLRWAKGEEAARKAVANETSGYRECATCKHGDVHYPGATKCRECSTCCEDNLSSWELDARKAVAGEGK